MNENIEYTLRILLTARDEVSAHLKALRTELKGFADDLGGVDGNLDAVNKRITSLNDRSRSAAKNIEKLRNEYTELGKALEKESDLEGKKIVILEREGHALGKAAQATEQRTEATKKGVTEDEKALAAEYRAEQAIQKRTKATRQATRSHEEARAAAEAALAKRSEADRRAAANAVQEQVDAEKALSTLRKELRRLRREGGVERKQPDEDIVSGEIRALVAKKREEIEAQSKLVDELTTRNREAAQAEILDAAQKRKDIEETLKKTAAKKQEKAAVEESTDTVEEETKAVKKNTQAKRDNIAVTKQSREERDREAVARVKESFEAEGKPGEAGRLAAARKRKIESAKEERARREAELALDDLEGPDFTHEDEEDLRRFMQMDEADAFDEFGQLGGGAPGKRETERAKAAETRRKRERKSLDDILNQYQMLSGAIAKARLERDRGKLSDNEWIFRLSEAEKVLRRLASRAAQMTTIDQSISSKIFGHAERLGERTTVLRDRAHAPVEENAVSKRQHTAVTDRAAASEARFHREVEAAQQALERENEAIRTGQRDWRESASALRLLSNDFAKLSRSQHANREQAIQLGVVSDDLRQRIAALRQEHQTFVGVSRRTGEEQRGLIAWLERSSDAINRQGESVAALDNRLRGMVVLAVMAFASQLITAMLALGGALTAVASSAVMAGAAIGGALVAGIAQALPVVGLLALSLLRVKDVMDAVNQAQLVDQQRFQRANDNRKKTADTTDAVANAEDGLLSAQRGQADAQRRVAEAQEALNRAREDARRQIRDLIQAEREAELAARGATLSQAEAQEALQRAVSEGDVGALGRAEDRVLEADQGVRRARNQLGDARAGRRRAARGVEQQDNVVQARRALDDAKRSAEDAGRAVERAQRGVEKAQRSASAAAEDQFSGLEKLQFLLKQMSPAERDLYHAIRRVQQTFRTQFRPITDIFIGEYARSVNTVDRLMRDKRLQNSAKGMAEGIVGELGRIRKEFTSNAFIRQFLRVMDQAKDNLRPLGDIVINLGHAFANIAEAAGPALTKILEWFEGLSDRILALTDDNDKLTAFFDRAADHFIAWMDALEAIVVLLATIAGIGESTGFSMIEDLTRWAKETTQDIKDNRGDVKQFFEDSREVLKILLHLLGAIGSAMLEVFEPGHIEPLARFIETAVLPALVSVIKFMGQVSTILFKILDLPFVNELATWLIALTLFSKVITSTANLFGGMLGQFAHFFNILDRATFGRFNRALGGLQTSLGGVARVLGSIIGRIPGLGRLGDALVGLGDKWKRSGMTKAMIDPVTGRQIRPGETSELSRGRATQPGGMGPSDSRYTVLPGPRNLPREVPPPPPSRRRRFTRGALRGAGAAALIGGGLYAMTPGGAEDFEDIPRSTAGAFGADIKQTFSSLLSLDLGGFWKGLTRNTKEFKEWVDKAQERLDELVKNKNKQGLRDIAEEADKWSKDFPEYADALRTFADTALQSINDINKAKLDDAREQLRLTRESVKRTWDAFEDGRHRLTDIRKAVQLTTEVIKDRVKDPEAAGSLLAKNFRRTAREIKQSMDDNKISVKTGTDAIEKYLVKALVATGTPEADAQNLIRHGTRQNKGMHQPGQGLMPGAATGGIIGNWGERGKDLVNAWIGRGEVVLNHWQQSALNAMLPPGVNVRDVVERIRGFHAGGYGDTPGLGFARGGSIVPIAGQGGNGTPIGVEYISSAIKGLVQRLVRRYRLLITDAFDPTGRKHKSPGHLTTGTAVDFVPGPRGSWDLVEALGRWAVGRGLTVGYGAGVPGSQPWPGHGRGNHIHIEFKGGVGGDLGGFMTAAQAIPRIISRLSGTATNRIAQGALDRTRRSAMDTYDRITQDAGMALGPPTGAGGKVPPGQVRQWLSRALRIVGAFSPVNLSALFGRTMQESGGNPKAINLWDSNAAAGNPSKGLLQTIDSTFQRFRLRGLPNDIWNPVANAVAAIRYMLATYGHIVGPSSTGYAQGGVIGGTFGKAVNIAAHAGEWILNLPQQQKLASMLGMGRDTLRAAMGFTGSNRRGFAGGGEVSDDERRLNQTFTSEFERDRVRRIARGIYQIPMLAIRDWEDLMREVQRAWRALSNLGKKQMNRVRDINQLTRDGGLFDQMDAAREQMGKTFERQISRMTFKLKKLTRGGFFIEKQDNAIDVAERELTQAKKLLSLASTEEGSIGKALDNVNKRLRTLRRGGVKTNEAAEVRALETQRNNLRERLSGIRDEITQQTEAVWNAQVAAQQAAVDDISRRFGKDSSNLDFLQRIVQAIGNTAGMKKINDARIHLLKDQAAELEKVIRRAEGSGNTELAEQLRQQVQDLQVQVFEMAQQAARDAMDAINTTAQRRGARLDLIDRMQTALGNVGLGSVATVAGESMTRGGVFAARMSALGTQRNDLQELLRSVQNDPVTAANGQLIQDLTDQLAELDVTIQETSRAEFQSRIDDVGNRAQFNLGINDLNKRITELKGDIAGTQDFTKLISLTQERGNILSMQGEELAELLAEAQQRGDQQAINDLTQQLLENEVAVLENTKALDELTGKSSQPQTFSSSAWQWFREAIFTGMGDVLPTYMVPSAATGGIVTKSGLLQVHSGEPVVPAHIARMDDWGNGGDTFNFEINEAGGEIDVTRLASTLAFAKKTAQR